MHAGDRGGDMGGRRQCKKWSWTHSNITGMCINRHAGLFDAFVWQHIEITSEIQMCSCWSWISTIESNSWKRKCQLRTLCKQAKKESVAHYSVEVVYVQNSYGECFGYHLNFFVNAL